MTMGRRIDRKKQRDREDDVEKELRRSSFARKKGEQGNKHAPVESVEIGNRNRGRPHTGEGCAAPRWFDAKCVK